MPTDTEGLHTLAAHAAAVLGVAGPLVAIGYAVRVDTRDSWRTPMMVAAALAWLSIIAALYTGHRLGDERPALLDSPSVAPHLEYAGRLLLPGTGFFVVAMLTGLLNPRTGVLRTMLPMLLTGFSLVVLVLVLLTGVEGVRELWDTVATSYQ